MTDNQSPPTISDQPNSIGQPTNSTSPVQDVDQRESVSAQVLTQAMLNDTQPMQVQYGPSGKEQEPFQTVEQGWDLPAGLNAVEEEPQAEISPEVEKYISAVKQDHTQIPQEVVIAEDLSSMKVQPHYVARPVIVLPMTKAKIEQGLKEPEDRSVRWFSEWAQKIWKMFSGEVVYQDDSSLSRPT